jgi:hypothetical protein
MSTMMAVPILSGQRFLNRPISRPMGMPMTKLNSMANTPIWIEMGSFLARMPVTEAFTL